MPARTSRAYHAGPRNSQSEHGNSGILFNSFELGGKKQRPRPGRRLDPLLVRPNRLSTARWRLADQARAGIVTPDKRRLNMSFRSTQSTAFIAERLSVLRP